jgi:hypothetical protein
MSLSVSRPAFVAVECKCDQALRLGALVDDLGLHPRRAEDFHVAPGLLAALGGKAAQVCLGQRFERFEIDVADE